MAHVRKGSFRRNLLVDSKVQGVLVTRVALYWIMCLVTVGMLLLCWRVLSDPAEPFYTHFRELWRNYGPPAIASLFLLPLVLLDVIRLSNRFAGPMLRMRCAMRALALGEHVATIEFREGDYWQDFADEFNAVAARIQGQAVALPSEGEEHDEPATVGVE